MIILLSGSINSGKTTVSKQLIQLLPRTAHVEVDILHDFVPWMTLDEAIPLNLQNAVAVTRCFVQFGLNVVISYPLPDEDYDYLMGELQPLAVPIFTVTLSPALDVALTNRGARELTRWEKQRIPYHYSTGINSPSFGRVIDNTHQMPEETARLILAMMEDKKNA
jgi:hypothetical protein